MRFGKGWIVWGLIVGVGTLVLASPGCSTSRYKTSANVDVEYDFSKVDSFALQPLREKVTHSAGGDVLAGALRNALAARGYAEESAEQADVLISYDLGRYAPAKLSGSSSFAITEGTLTVRVIDPASGRTVWYGWVETRLRTNDDDTVIEDAVAALFDTHIPAVAASTP